MHNEPVYIARKVQQNRNSPTSFKRDHHVKCCKEKHVDCLFPIVLLFLSTKIRHNLFMSSVSFRFVIYSKLKLHDQIIDVNVRFYVCDCLGGIS